MNYCILLQHSDITNYVTQRHTSPASMVIVLNKNQLMGICARIITRMLITMPINSRDGIKLSLDTPLNKTKNLNIVCAIVLRQ